MISAKNKSFCETFADLRGQPNMPGEVPLKIEWSKPAWFFGCNYPEKVEICLLTPKNGVLLEWTMAMLVETHPTICISCIYTRAGADEITPWWESLCFSFFAVELRFFRNLATVKLALRWRAKRPRFWMGDQKRAGELSGTILRPTQKLFNLGTFGWFMKNQPR